MKWAKGYAEKNVETKEGIAIILSYRGLLKVRNLSQIARAELFLFFRFPCRRVKRFMFKIFYIIYKFIVSD
jgi:hypothetical protein